MEDILAQAEIEVYVSNFNTSKIEELGEIAWYEKHKRLHMLYQEALLETHHNSCEKVKETVLVHGKMKTLLCEVITMSIWRHKIFSLLCCMDLEKEKLFAVYIMLYHEGTAFGLLELLAFYPDCLEHLQETIVDLLDYTVQNVLLLITRKVPQVMHEKICEMTPEQELRHYESTVVHNLGLRSIVMIRLISEALDVLPLSIVNHFYKSHDIPMLLCQVLELSPWYTSDIDGKRYQFVDAGWKSRDVVESEAINKSEGQTWLCLRQLVLDPRLLQHYELNDFRVRNMCKLIRYLHDEMLDQLSPLSELKHFLSQLSVANIPPPQTKPFIFELDPKYKEKIESKYSNKWERIAKKEAENIRKMSMKQIQSVAHGISEAYHTLDLVDPEPAKCANCGEQAFKRCSRCKCEWYCGRECQVKMWSKHKSACEILSESSANKLN